MVVGTKSVWVETGLLVGWFLPREQLTFDVCSLLQSGHLFLYASFLHGQATLALFSQDGLVSRVGQNHIYTVYIRCFWQGNYQIYGHIHCIYTVLANPTYQVYLRHWRSEGWNLREKGSLGDLTGLGPWQKVNELTSQGWNSAENGSQTDLSGLELRIQRTGRKGI